MIQTKTKSHLHFFLIIFFISLIGLTGCQQSNASNSSGNNSDQTTTANNFSVQQNTKQLSNMNLPKLKGKATIEMKVNGETITIEVDGDNAPVTAGNFVDLVQKGVYDGLVFHRVVKQPQPFVAQGGDPQSKDPNFPVARLGTGSYIDPNTGSARYIPLEITPEGAKEPIYSKTIKNAPALKHDRGVVAMARSQSPDSASSQFYFTLADLPFLDGNYAVFGKVTEGMNVVDNIKQGDIIQSAKVISGGDNLQ